MNSQPQNLRRLTVKFGLPEGTKGPAETHHRAPPPPFCTNAPMQPMCMAVSTVHSTGVTEYVFMFRYQAERQHHSMQTANKFFKYAVKIHYWKKKTLTGLNSIH